MSPKLRVKKSPGAFIDYFFRFEDDNPYIGFVVRLCYLDNFEDLKRSVSQSDAISFLEMIIAQTKHMMRDEYYPISPKPICNKYYPYISEIDEDFGHINVQTTKQMEENILCLVSLTQLDDMPMEDVADKAIKILQCVEFRPKK